MINTLFACGKSKHKPKKWKIPEGVTWAPTFFFMETPMESRSDTSRNMCLNI